MTEAAIQQQIRLALGRVPGLVLWRNQAGVAERDGRTMRFGLAKGASDLIGIYATEIRPEHVGLTLGRFVALEVKSATGRLSTEQALFIDLVRDRGGLAGVCRSVEDAQEVLGL